MKRKFKHLLSLILVVSILLGGGDVVYGNVTDNVQNASIEQSIGSSEGKQFNTIFDFLQSIWEQLNTMSTQIQDVMSMRNDISEVKTAVNALKLDVSVSAAQTYITMLNDYQTNGTSSSVYTDKTLWDQLCRSSTMINSKKYNGEALDYWIDKGYDLSGYFYQIAGINSTLFSGMTTAQEVLSNSNTLSEILGNELACTAYANSRRMISATASVDESFKNQIRNSSQLKTACTSSRLLRWVNVHSVYLNGSGLNTASIQPSCFYYNCMKFTYRLNDGITGDIATNQGDYFSGSQGTYALDIKTVKPSGLYVSGVPFVYAYRGNEVTIYVQYYCIPM